MEELRELFELDEMPELAQRYNVAPTQPVAVIRKPRRLELLRWGLLLPNAPSRGGARGINVRLESVARAPAYRDAFRTRRCLVIVDGFFEWKRQGHGKRPFYVRRGDGKPFALAGIWESYVLAHGQVVDACAVLTGDAKGVVADLHDRMPVILQETEVPRWAGTNVKDASFLLKTSAESLVAYPVSSRVNSPDHEGPGCIEAVESPAGNLELF